MLYIIVVNASLLIISLIAGMYTLFVHTDFPKRMSDDDIEKYRTVAENHSKTVRGCALTSLASGFVFYGAIPALLILFNVDIILSCLIAVLLLLIQMAGILLIYKIMSSKLSV